MTENGVGLAQACLICSIAAWAVLSWLGIIVTLSVWYLWQNRGDGDED